MANPALFTMLAQALGRDTGPAAAFEHFGKAAGEGIENFSQGMAATEKVQKFRRGRKRLEDVLGVENVPEELKPYGKTRLRELQDVAEPLTAVAALTRAGKGEPILAIGKLAEELGIPDGTSVYPKDIAAILQGRKKPAGPKETDPVLDNALGIYSQFAKSRMSGTGSFVKPSPDAKRALARAIRTIRTKQPSFVLDPELEQLVKDLDQPPAAAPAAVAPPEKPGIIDRVLESFRSKPADAAAVPASSVPAIPAQPSPAAGSEPQPAAGAGRRVVDQLPDPRTLKDGTIVTDQQSGRKLKVQQGRYIPQ